MRLKKVISILLCTVLIFSLGACSTSTTDASYECDVVIVGSGPSGMSAAIQAADLGADVIVLEKLDVTGGMSFGTEGMFGLGSSMQKEEDLALPSINEIVKEELEYTNYKVDPLRWRDFVSASGENIDWLKSHGVEFEGVTNYMGISSFECFHWFVGHTGATMTGTLANEMETMGIEVMTGTPATELLIEDDKVVGVIASKTSTDEKIIIKSKSVILATGGFANNTELLSKKTGWDSSRIMSMPNKNVGDGYNMAIQAGGTDASSCNIPVISVLGYDALSNIGAVSWQPYLTVNENGERFISESLINEKFHALYSNAHLTQNKTFLIFDTNTVKTLQSEGPDYGMATVKSGIALDEVSNQLEEAIESNNGSVYKAETIEDLATDTGIDTENLIATIDRYNKFCDTGKDIDFNNKPNDLYPVKEGPYYALVPSVTILTSIGGFAINRDNQVISEKGEPIPGLFSAGVDSNMLYDGSYNYQLSGGLMGYNVYSGRNAAQNAIQD
ncbi:MAG: FAD-dependent oxidoreductase [Eubacteriaceae bacterium]